MIRKQLYITPEQEKKLRTLARERHCTEAEVVRSAIDRLPQYDNPAVRLLAEAGLLVPPPDDEDIPTEEEMEQLEREYDEWLASRSEPLNLSDAVEQDREEGW
jgi:methylthioribose-1-phosphate isomerase